MSIMPPEPDGKSNSPEPSVRGVAQMMVHSADPFTREVGALLEHIGFLHEHPVACDDCRDGDGPCVEVTAAHSITYAWLLRLIEERG